MIKSIFTALILGLSLTTMRPLLAGSVEHVETNDIREIWKYVSVNTVVIFELENVCMTCTHQLGREEWADAYAKGQIRPEQSFGEARGQITPLWNHILCKATMQPIDHSVQKVIRDLQAKNIYTIGLSCKDPDIAYPMLGHLRSLDIDFLKHPPLNCHLAIRADHPAKFVDGVLFTGVYNHPGYVVANFLESVRDCFRLVVVSNSLPRLQRIYQGVTCGGERNGLSFVGIRLGLADQQIATLDPKICEVQLKYFNKIISNEAAEVLLPPRSGWFW